MLNSKSQKQLTIHIPKTQSKLSVLFLLVLSMSLVIIPITNVYAVVPGQVTGLTATAQTNALTIDLSWNAVTATPNVTGYKIERKVGAGAFSVLVADTGSTATTYSDTGLSEGTTYTYRVSAINVDGTGPASNEASATTNSSPGAPTGLTATKQTNALTIDLSWTTPASNGGSAITGYKIERESPVSGGFSVLVANTGSTTTTYSNTGLSQGTQYNYRVSAINAIGTSTASNEASATTNSAPGTPTGLTATAQADVLTIDLSWTAPASDGGSAITGYKIERKVGAGAFSTLVADTASTSTSYSDTGLSQGTQYTYRISAINAIGTSSASSESSATTSDVPTSPTLSLSVTKRGISLSWTTPDNMGSAITGYKIERASVGGAFSTLVGNTGNTATSSFDSCKSPRESFSYRVSAINAIGTGSASSEVSATCLPSGSSCHDCKAPSFNKVKTTDEFPLAIAGKLFKLPSHTNTIDTVHVSTGTTFSIKLSLYDDGGPHHIQHVALYLNLKDHQVNESQSDTYIVWEKGKEIEVRDPHDFLRNTNVTASISSSDPSKLEITFDLNFVKPLEKSHLIISMWDEKRNGSITKIFDALKVTGDYIGAEKITSEDEVYNEPSLIPHSLKEQLMKKTQGRIQDSDIIFILTELDKEGILDIKEIDIQNEKSLDELKIISSSSDYGMLSVQKGYQRGTDLLLIQGYVSDYARGARIGVDITTPDEVVQVLSFYPTKEGSFYLPLFLDANSKDGFYKLKATYNEEIIGDLDFTIGHKSKIESAKPLLKNIISSWLKDKITDDTFIERLRNLLK